MVLRPDPKRVYQYCQQQNNLFKKLNDGSITGMEDLATSHTSLAQGYLLLDDYANAVSHCDKCIELESDMEDIKSGQAMNQFANIYASWGHYGLGEYTKAAERLLQVLEFRQRRYGIDDTESIKYAIGNLPQHF
jgi:tetratricopeptide (TPR) repeat protein